METLLSTPLQPSAPRLLYTPQQVCCLLSLSTRKLAYLMAQGRIRTRKINGSVRIEHDELQRFCRRDRIRPQAQ